MQVCIMHTIVILLKTIVLYSHLYVMYVKKFVRMNFFVYYVYHKCIDEETIATYVREAAVTS